MSIAYLGLGSNVNAKANISAGISNLRVTFSHVVISPIYRSRAVGFEGNDFINLVARIETRLCPLDLKHYLNDLEDHHGRARDVPKFSDRTLDIDILLYDDLWLLSPVLQIPRHEILTAAYVLKPLAELAPKLVHPACRRTIGELWNEFPEKDTALELIKL